MSLRAARLVLDALFLLTAVIAGLGLSILVGPHRRQVVVVAPAAPTPTPDPWCQPARVVIYAQPYYRQPKVWWVWVQPRNAKDRLIAPADCPGMPEPVWTVTPEGAGLALTSPWAGDLGIQHAGVYQLHARVGALEASKEVRWR